MPKTSKPRRDIEQEVTDRIISALETGTVPWTKPWVGRSGMLPTSVATGRPYRGINALLLWLESEAKGYESPYWMTYRQAQERGGNVRKGEHGTQVIFWKRIEVADENAPEPDATKSVFFLRYFTVFNLDQTENVTLPPRFNPPERENRPVPEVVAEVIEGYENGPEVKFVEGDSAHYSPASDIVVLPLVEQFATEAGFAGAAFHELIHSTGHASRLDRFQRTGEPQHFGSERYAREELVAEMGAAMVGALVGTGTEVEQSAAYVANWLKALRDDKTLVVKAAQAAQKAVDLVLGSGPEKVEEPS